MDARCCFEENQKLYQKKQNKENDVFKIKSCDKKIQKIKNKFYKKQIAYFLEYCYTQSKN